MALHYPAGNYWARVTGFKMGVSSNGNPQWLVSIMPYAYENTAAPVDSQERWGSLPCKEFERTMFLTITQGTIQRRYEDLDFLGLCPDSWDELDQDHPKAVDFMNREIPVYCKHGEYDGKPKEEWNINRGGGGLPVKPIEKDQMRQLNAMFNLKSKMKKTTAAPPAPAKAATPTPPAPVEREPGEDDLPFE
jgi:hypothetical protein